MRIPRRSPARVDEGAGLCAPVGRNPWGSRAGRLDDLADAAGTATMIKVSQQGQDAPVAPLATRILFALRMGRPHFLIGGLLLHWLGVAMALASGAPLRLPALLWAQAAVTIIQLMTHYSNDYFDLAADQANPTPTHWSGGSRVLTGGWLAPQVAL